MTINRPICKYLVSIFIVIMTGCMDSYLFLKLKVTRSFFCITERVQYMFLVYLKVALRFKRVSQQKKN